MTLRGLLTAVIALATAVVVGACGVGPEPRPVTDKQLDSGEETARQAGESARQARDDDEGRVLYATSRSADDEPDDVQDQPDEDIDPDVDAAATIYVGPDGEFIDESGDEVDLEALDELSDDPLEGRALRVVVDPDAEERSTEELMPLFEAIADEGAFADVSTGDTPVDED